MKVLKEKLEEAKNMRYKAEVRLENLEREEKEILRELEELNVQPEQLEEEIEKLKNELTHEMDHIWNLLPSELKK